MRARVQVLLLCVMSLVFANVYAVADDERFPPSDSNRILFVGDSITYAGHYVAMVEACLRVAEPDRAWKIVNLGLPSETCTGLSEPSHPFPRPNVHERLERALRKFKPDVVVACYGMNDGIYHPFSEERFAAYQEGINELISKVDAAGATLVLMTPPPFDPVALKDKGSLQPANASEFVWTAIYEDYDAVLKRYSAWILDQRDRVEMVIDLRTPVERYLAERRKTEPDFSFSPDGVHMNSAGHRVLANAILADWGYGVGIPDNENLLRLVERRELILRDAWLSHVGHQRPGVKDGLPLNEANTGADTLLDEINTLIKSPPSR